jgi:hypothetical protein
MMKIITNIFFVASVSAFCQSAVAGTYQDCIATANEINQSVPQQIDKVTVLLNATCKEEGKRIVLVYNYLLETENVVTKQAIESLKPGQINAVCTSPEIKPLLDLVLMEFSYSGQNRKFIGSNRISKKDCRSAR